MTRYKLIFTLFLYSNALSFLFSQNNTEIENKIDEIFASWKAEGPGGVVGVVRDGELTFAKAYGMASLEYEVPNTVETKFNIASVSKQISAYAIVLLQEQGKLSIDDDIRKYLPEVPEFDKTITIRHLLTHTSGFRNFQNMLSMAGWRQGDPMTNDDLLRFVSRQKELNFPVGEEYLYCNTGFVLATFIVERVTGKDFKDWTNENIFDPLGMYDTDYREDMSKVHTRTAKSYSQVNSTTFTTPLEFYNYMGNGNVYTTIGDMGKWMAHLGSGHQNFEVLTTPGILNNGDTLGYALGIGVGEFNGHRRWSHGGSIGGYRSNLMYFPDDQLGVMVIGNFNTSNPGGKVSQIAKHLLNIQDESADVPGPTSSYFMLKDAIEQDIKIFKPHEGSYYVDGVIVDVYSREGNRYMIAHGETPEFPIAPASDTSYFNILGGISVYFTEGSKKLVINRNGQMIYGERLMTDAGDMDEITGTFYSPELDTEYTIQVEDGSLKCYHQRHGTFNLYPLSDDRVKGAIYPFADIKVIRWINGDVKGLRVSNGRVRDMWFGKR
ncbi:MAG: beta-lactamase family protein [Saprospiraceae bacterium]|nr:beta-lactamase family protein [Saprospiraceae bacterium]